MGFSFYFIFCVLLATLWRSIIRSGALTFYFILTSRLIFIIIITIPTLLPINKKCYTTKAYYNRSKYHYWHLTVFTLFDFFWMHREFIIAVTSIIKIITITIKILLWELFRIITYFLVYGFMVIFKEPFISTISFLIPKLILFRGLRLSETSILIFIIFIRFFFIFLIFSFPSIFLDIIF